MVDGVSQKLDGGGLDEQGSSQQTWSNQRPQAMEWQPEPNTPRIATGVKNRVGRLKGLGNAIVPQVAYQLIRMMIEAETTL